MSSTASIVKLTATNYHEWRFVIEGFFHEESITISSANALPAKENGKALRLIRQSVSKDVIPFIYDIVDARLAWTTLETQFGGRVTDDSKFLNLQNFFAVRMESSENLQHYLSRTKNLFNKTRPTIKVENDTLPVFTVNEYQYVAVVVNGLPTELRNEVNKRLTVTDNLKGSDLETLLSNITRDNSGGTKESPIEVAIVKKKRKKPNILFCNHCRKSGHKEENCFVKYPDKRPKPGNKKPKPVHTIEVSVAETDIPEGNSWLVDTCAGAHIVGDREIIHNLQVCEEFFFFFFFFF